MSKDRPPKFAFMDRTTFNWELGEAGEVELYGSARDLALDYGSCLDECGIVEVSVKLHRVVWSGCASKVVGKTSTTAEQAKVDACGPALIAMYESRIRRLQEKLARLKENS